MDRFVWRQGGSLKIWINQQVILHLADIKQPIVFLKPLDREKKKT